MNLDNEIPIICPHCKNDNQSMLEFSERRREEVRVFCNTCSFSWTHKFDVPPEQLVKFPKGK